MVNLKSTLSPDEFIAIVDEHDEPTGQVTTRHQMREHNLWHRSTAIFVIDEHLRFCLNKRSHFKDYCPGWLDTSFGGIVGAHEIDDVDGAALREAEEEMGIARLDSIKLPSGKSGQTLKPKFVFKHKFEDSGSRAWVYTYYIAWHSALKDLGTPIKP